MPVAAILFFEVISLRSLVSFTDFPELDGFICMQENNGALNNLQI